jgi:hypothetical protein
LIWREVTNLPSRPANGLSLTWKIIEMVGSSTVSGGMASTCSGSHSVSEMLSGSTPLKVMMSPAEALSRSTFSRPWKPNTCSTLALRVSPSAPTTVTCWFFDSVPRRMRPRPITPV